MKGTQRDDHHKAKTRAWQQQPGRERTGLIIRSFLFIIYTSKVPWNLLERVSSLLWLQCILLQMHSHPGWLNFFFFSFCYSSIAVVLLYTVENGRYDHYCTIHPPCDSSFLCPESTKRRMCPGSSLLFRMYMLRTIMKISCPPPSGKLLNIHFMHFVTINFFIIVAFENPLICINLSAVGWCLLRNLSRFVSFYLLHLTERLLEPVREVREQCQGKLLDSHTSL